MQALDAPERAIQAFEKIHRLRVTIHDIRGTLGPAVVGERFRHCHPLCQCVKASSGRSRCEEFELQRLRKTIESWSGGRYHVCHAGLVEWVIPVYDNLQLDWIMFAGVRAPSRELGQVHQEPAARWVKSPWRRGQPLPEKVEKEEAQLILEHFLQLGARLRLWAREAPVRPDRIAEKFKSSLRVQRNTFIRRFIDAYYAHPIRLKDLARELEVSDDRATHLVRESCGETFRALLLNARLRAAQQLLRMSSLPILEVAFSSGFGEVCHFNRYFKRSLGMTPSAYRRSHSAQQ